MQYHTYGGNKNKKKIFELKSGIGATLSKLAALKQRNRFNVLSVVRLDIELNFRPAYKPGILN